VQMKRPNQEKLFWQSMAFVLLTVTALCLTTLGAAAQQSAADQAPTTEQAPATTEQAPYPEKAPASTPPPTTQAPAAQAPAPTQQPTTTQVPYTEQAPAAAAQPQTAPAPRGEQGPESVHVMVGHSMLIRTPSRIKRVLTGNPAVIESVLTSPRELVITAKAPGGSSLMLWDEAGQSRSLDVYADLDVTQLRNTLDQSFPNNGVDVQSEGNRVMLVGTVPTAPVAEQILKMANNYSKDVVNGLHTAPPPHLKQVMLKVRFAEADRSKLSAFGFNLFSTGATNTIGTIGTQQFGPLAIQGGQTGGTNNGTPQQFTLSDLLNIFIFRSDINLGATVKLLQQKNILQILAEPNLMAYSGVPAKFLAGGEFPYPVVQGGGVGSVPIITIQFRPYGVKLEFTGTIEDNGVIRLKVAPEVSSLDYSNTVTISGFVLPSISTRRAETEVELKDGQSFGIAGLLDDRTTVLLSKVPGIGDIPILGQLFRSRSTNRSSTELLVLVTPTIVDPVAGPLPPPEVQVNPPVQNLDKGGFDKGLPDPTKNPGTK
jgi:pilus assembly protein CpaC